VVYPSVPLVPQVAEMNDKEFWICVRQALLAFVDAIERRWCIGKHAK
jgi:hypothetical protein